MSIGAWRFRYRHWLLVFLLLLGGCTTVGDMRPRGTFDLAASRYFPLPHEEIFDLTQEALEESGFTLREVAPGRRYIIAERIPGWLEWGWGEIVGIYFSPDGATGAQVLVVTRKRWAMDAVPKDWTEDIYRGLFQKVRQRVKKP